MAAGAGWRGASRLGQGDGLDLRLGRLVEFDLEFVLVGLDGDGLDDGGIPGLAGRRCGVARGDRLAERRHAEGHRADGQLIADLQGLLAEDPLAVDECAVGAAQVAHGELAPGIEELAVLRLTCDDLMRMMQSSWRPRLVTPSASLSVVVALRPRTT